MAQAVKTKERIQKIMAHAGICSRRKAEELILEGAVTLNGKIAKLGDQAERGKDSIKVNGKLIFEVESPIYIVFHKPKAVLCQLHEDIRERPTLEAYFKKIKRRIYPVGRMDFNSEGIMFLTNDGDFAERLQKDDDIKRSYLVKIKGHPDEEILGRLAKPMRVDRRPVCPTSVEVETKYTQKSLIKITFTGAGLVDVKAFFEAKRLLVERVVRYSIGHMSIDNLPSGQYKILKKSQIDALFI